MEFTFLKANDVVKVTINKLGYIENKVVTPVVVSPENTLNEGVVWPWPAKEEWDAKNLRKLMAGSIRTFVTLLLLIA